MRTTNTQSMGSAAEEQNKQVVHQFFEALNQRDIDRIEQLVSSTNYSFHFPGMLVLIASFRNEKFCSYIALLRAV